VLTSLSATPSHRAYAAKEKGAAGPVRRRRKTGTLDEIYHKMIPVCKKIFTIYKKVVSYIVSVYIILVEVLWDIMLNYIER
jgi:hypothetical protein